jgi:hypothetical protein
VKANLEKHIGKGANGIHFPLTPQHVMFILRYGSFSMSFATLQATWNLMNWINIRSDGSKLVAHFYLPIFYKLRMKKILLE